MSYIMKDIDALKLLRVPFSANQISQLPKPTRKQTDEVKADFKKGVRCEICGGWHHPNVIHLDYVGHAALTDRLLEVDPMWDWRPLSTDEKGLPQLTNDGGLWISLTVCGVTRLGYGDAQGKTGGDAVKELIGDAIRNAGMRFGAALDLWHKGDLHEKPEKIEQISPEPINEKRVSQAYDTWKAIVDADVDEMDYKTVQTEYALLTNDERIAVSRLFGSDKPEGSKKGYKAVIKELLNISPADLDNPDNYIATQ